MLRATQSQRLFSQTQDGSGGGGGRGGGFVASTYSSQSDVVGAGTGSSVLWATGGGGGRKVLPMVPRFSSAAASSSQQSQISTDAFPSLSSSSQGAPITITSSSSSQSSQDDVTPAPTMGKRFKLSKAKGGAGQADAVRVAEEIRNRALAAQKENRRTTVTKFRTYRKGELPDIMITPRDLLAPLQSLVHHDALIAKLAFGQLYTSVRKQQLGNQPQSMEQLHDGVANLLQSNTHGGPAFVGCLHELALSEEGSDLKWLPPTLAASSARFSGNLHSGILILERHLANAGDAASGSGSDGGGGRGGS